MAQIDFFSITVPQMNQKLQLLAQLVGVEHREVTVLVNGDFKDEEGTLVPLQLQPMYKVNTEEPFNRWLYIETAYDHWETLEPANVRVAHVKLEWPTPIFKQEQ